MDVFTLVMYLFAFVCFVLATVGTHRVPHVNLMALGLAFALLPALVNAVTAVAGT
jgi:hypothetical protein